MLRVLFGSFEQGARRTLFPLVLFMACALGGAACRGDDTIAPAGVTVALDDSDASPIAGTIQGAFAVSSTGEATYSMPLVVPPGAAGMQPSLAIAYDSASGDGMLGVGFSLTGLSAVTRCALTTAQDGQIRGVRYDQLDGLCLDGARLVPVGSSGGVVEYRTFPDTFVKVLAYPSKVAENTADKLTVFTRSGLILEYGTSPDSKVMGRSGAIRSWLVKRVSDRSENTIEYEYLNLSSGRENTVEYVPFRIRYTGNKGVLPSRTVQFAYEPKAESDARAFFAGGTALTSTRQLTSITMLGPEGSLVRSAWESEGGLSGLASVVLGPGREQVATAVDRAGEGDFRGAATAGVKAISVGVTTGIAVGELGAAAVGAIQESRPSGLQPGPRAGGSIPARGPERDFTKDERVQINEIGRDSGYHTCGSKEPGTKSGNFIPDHQPPTRLAPPGTPQRLFPHCRSCSLRQGGEVNGELTRK